MPLITSRILFGHQNPYRTVRPVTSKIIFLAFEGSATEEEYFEMVSSLFSTIKSKIQFISVAEDAVHTAPKVRTPDQVTLLSKARPKQLVERIDQFKIEKNGIYQFSLYPEDEFWIVTDVDQNWSSEVISPSDGKSYLDEWNDAIAMCEAKKYGYAVSNPFLRYGYCFTMMMPTMQIKDLLLLILIPMQELITLEPGLMIWVFP